MTSKERASRAMKDMVDIIKMFRDTPFETTPRELEIHIERAIDAAVAEEREACAKMLDEEANFNGGANATHYVNSDAENDFRCLAAEIRNRATEPTVQFGQSNPQGESREDNHNQQ